MAVMVKKRLVCFASAGLTAFFFLRLIRFAVLRALAFAMIIVVLWQLRYVLSAKLPKTNHPTG